MRELILEHATARRTVTILEKQEANYIGGNAESLGSILESLNTLIELYPRHIEKEDKHFFYQSCRTSRKKNKKTCFRNSKNTTKPSQTTNTN